jgi:uncharacterized membrane protein
MILRRGQAGQAIVLVAMVFAVLCGMVALAVDGGRVYVERRELQEAVDAAALYAGDSLINNSNTYATAEQNGVNLYAKNVRISSGTSAS